jgi:hypothetical protein
MTLAFINPFYVRTSVAFGIAAVTLAAAGYFTIRPKDGQPVPVQLFIAYNATIFVVLGFAVTISAADRWPAALLWAGAALFAGGLLGILFGIPTAADSVSANPSAATSAAVAANANVALQQQAVANDQDPPPPLGVKNHTLLADTAGFLSKFLAGAGIAQFKNILHYFLWLSHSVASYCILPDSTAHATVVGAGLLTYFGLVGFLSGIILPFFFLKNFP